MATSISYVQSVGVRACANSGNRKPDSSSTSQRRSAGWWTPLFGWTAEPDYIDSGNDKRGLSVKAEAQSDSDLDPRPVRTRLAPGSFTEKKARKLRMMTAESYHDKMRPTCSPTHHPLLHISRSVVAVTAVVQSPPLSSNPHPFLPSSQI